MQGDVDRISECEILISRITPQSGCSSEISEIHPQSLIAGIKSKTNSILKEILRKSTANKIHTTQTQQ